MMTIRHRHGTYSVEFTELTEIQNAIKDRLVFTDENVKLALNLQVERMKVLPPGEESKDIPHFVECIDWLVSQKATRTRQIVALGGGVIGDLIGFVAASYMRGIPYIQVPTTLLAMVDSAVGGKVAVDHGEAKNLIGAFHAPKRVLIALDALKRLPERQIRNGMAEVLKYGFIEDPRILESAGPDQETVQRCIEIKAKIVQEDEFETTGRRAELNFGHTVAHALEAETRYRELLHGEAVAIGMCAESILGENLGISPKGTASTTIDALHRYGLPTHHPLLAHPEPLLHRMLLDKKRSGDRLAFSLLTKIGECKLFTEIPSTDVGRACEMSCSFGESH